MTQFEKRQLKSPTLIKPLASKRNEPRLWIKYGISYAEYRKAYSRWWHALERGHAVDLELFIENKRVNLSRSRPKAYYYAKRQLSLALATPKWVDVEAIAQFYENRPIDHEVDHIIPIRGELVWGLHVPWNLQYLHRDAHNLKTIRAGKMKRQR